MKKLFIITLVLFFTASFAESSKADPVTEDIRANAVFDEGGITSGEIETAGGGGGNYELIICGINSDGPEPFNTPTPGTWNQLENGNCFMPRCQLGIWARITEPGSSQEITCSWGNDSTTFVAASLRFSNVDKDDPIIDMACSEVVGNNFVIAPVSSEPGAMSVSVSIFELEGTIPGGGDTFTDFEFGPMGGSYTAVAKIANEDVLVFSGGSEIDEAGEGFPGFEIPIQEFENAALKQCFLSIRMQTEAIPTMSEWGFMAVAVFMGAAGVWYLRRRKLEA